MTAVEFFLISAIQLFAWYQNDIVISSCITFSGLIYDLNKTCFNTNIENKCTCGNNQT